MGVEAREETFEVIPGAPELLWHGLRTLRSLDGALFELRGGGHPLYKGARISHVVESGLLMCVENPWFLAPRAMDS